jgi:DNA-binding LacI/PurR family transcriptional regulator
MGDTPWAQWITSPLTTISMGEKEITRLAIHLSTDPEMPPTTIFRVTPHLVERQSVASIDAEETKQRPETP